jgi:hypothetical protein
MPKTVRPERRLEIIVATIGVVAALAGAATGGATSYLVQRNQFTEDKASEARVKRAGVYAAYLRAANDGASEADGAYDRLAAQCRGPSRCSGVTLARGARAGEGASRLPGRPKRRLRLRDRRGLAAHQAPERDDAPDARLSDPPNQAREPGCVRLGVQRLPRKDLRRGSGEASSRLPLKRGSVPPLSPGRSKRLWLRGSPPSPKPQRQVRFLGPPSPP